MTLTPRFTLAQDDEYVYAVLQIPHAHLEDADLAIDGRQVTFHLQPYFLRLVLGHELVEDGREKGAYDQVTSTLTLSLPKLNRGQVFEDLAMITRWLPAPGPARGPVLIEVVDEGGVASERVASPTVSAEFDWSLPVRFPEPHPAAGRHPYGFNGLYTDYFDNNEELLRECVDVEDPAGTSQAQRRALREVDENDRFNGERVLDDMVMEAEMAEVMAWGGMPLGLTEEHRDTMARLVNREYLVDDPRPWLYAILDITYAVCYDARVNTGDRNVESGWTVSKLSPTLSWFDLFASAAETLAACQVRALVYPLLRHPLLAHKVTQDVLRVASEGRQALLVALLEARARLLLSDGKYPLPILYLDHLAVWLQRQVSDKDVEELAKEVQRATATWKPTDIKLRDHDLQAIAEQATEIRQEEGLESLEM
jgi:protein SHQ1